MTPILTNYIQDSTEMKSSSITYPLLWFTCRETVSNMYSNAQYNRKNSAQWIR